MRCCPSRGWAARVLLPQPVWLGLMLAAPAVSYGQLRRGAKDIHDDGARAVAVGVSLQDGRHTAGTELLAPPCTVYPRCSRRYPDCDHEAVIIPLGLQRYRVQTPFGELRAALVPPISSLAFCGPLLPRPGQPQVAATVTIDELAARVTSIQLARAWGPDRWVPAPPVVHDRLAGPVSAAVDAYLAGPGRALIRSRLDALLADVDTIINPDPTMTAVWAYRADVLRAAVAYDTDDPAVAEVATGLADGWDGSIAELLDAAATILRRPA